MKRKTDRTLDVSRIGADIAAELVDFACNQVKVTRIDGPDDFPEPPHPWIALKLLQHGQVGVVLDGVARGWYIINKLGTRDRYGRPTEVFARTEATSGNTFAFPTALTDAAPRTAIRVIRANPCARPPVRTITRYADTLARLDVGISANAIASMRSQIIGVSKGYEDSIDLLLQDASEGMPTTVTKDMLEDLQTADVSVPFDGNLRHALRQAIYAEALRHFGGVTPPQYKAERVQGAEVAASVAESIDSLYIMIDQFNADAERLSVPYRMEYIGFGAKYEETEVHEDERNNP